MVVKKKYESVEDFVNQGAPVAPGEAKENKWSNFTLRIRKDLLEQIGDAIEDRVGISKTVWILEAIQEKLKREANE